LYLKTDAAHWNAYYQMIENWLRSCLPETPADRLRQAMSYSLMAGGKRLRPMLTLEFCRICGGDTEAALPVACAVELVHTYSLIHDDLPAMDDDDLRRGKPTCHIAFDEATAILAGDALQAQAFCTVTAAQLPSERIAACVRELAAAASLQGMCGGQQLDLEAEGKRLSVQALEQLQQRKTGALIRAACRMGVLCAGGNEVQMNAADAFASALGLAFQIRDDMLDEIADEVEFGKPVGSDRAQGKCTFLTELGMDACAERVVELTEQAVTAIAALPDSERLARLAQAMAERSN